MRVWLGIALGALCVACGGGGSGNGPTPPTPPAPPAPAVSAVQVPSVTIDSGQVATLTATITFTGSTAPSVTAAWTSTDPSIATVASTGPLTATVTGRKGGAVSVAASAGGQTGTGTVTVRPDRRILTTRNLLFAKNWEPFAGGTPNSEVLLLPAGRDTIINLTFHPRSDDGMMWSGDGSRVFFSTSRDDPNNNDGSLANYTLYSMPVTGGAAQRVVGLGVLGWTAYGINPTTGRLHLLRVSTISEQEGFYTLNPDGTGLSRLASTSGLVPVNANPLPRSVILSFSTAQAAYITNKQLFIAAFAANPNPRAISITCTFSCDWLAWSKDDQRIAYLGDGGLWVLNVATGQNTRLADSDTQCRPDWSPNGAEIVYGHNGRLYVVNATTAVRTNLDQLDGCSIQWSPDGQLITYEGGPFRANLMIVRRSDGATRQVLQSQGLGNTYGVQWSPR